MAGVVSRRLLRRQLRLPGSLRHQLRLSDSLRLQPRLPGSPWRCLGGDPLGGSFPGGGGARQSASEEEVESGAVVFPLSRRVVKYVCLSLSPSYVSVY